MESDFSNSRDFEVFAGRNCQIKFIDSNNLDSRILGDFGSFLVPKIIYWH